MGKQYEIALSYARNDEKIAKIIGAELEMMFAEGFFMDVLRPEELAAAEELKNQLRNIFHRSKYAVILYSENYMDGNFTLVELGEILQKDKEHLFVIRIKDKKEEGDTNAGEPIYREWFGKHTYLPLNVGNADAGNDMGDKNLRQEIHDIIHGKIKKKMIEQSVEERKMEKIYAVNINTMFIPGIVGLWKMDYDWNVHGKAFIGEDGKSIRQGSSWKDLWKYVAEEFLWIKEALEPKADVMRRIRFNCHLCIAYKLGQIYGDLGQASGNRNLELLSSNSRSDIVFTFGKKVPYGIGGSDVRNEYGDLYSEYDGNDPGSNHFICIVSIKPREQANILETVKYYLKEHGCKYRKIVLFQKKMLINDADTLEKIAEYLRIKIHQCVEECGVYGGYTVHLFPDTTAPLMFALGARSVIYGEKKLYEFNSSKNSYVEAEME